VPVVLTLRVYTLAVQGGPLDHCTNSPLRGGAPCRNTQPSSKNPPGLRGTRYKLHVVASIGKHCTDDDAAGPGKHTFLEGGVRVMAFIAGPRIPPGRRGTRWTGMAASADWYKTIVEGIAHGTVPAESGTRPPDALNLWPAILGGCAGC
jgi:hypothetical protein